ncbi:MAG: PilZ domain-containing protein [Terracidiphilus sp.]
MALRKLCAYNQTRECFLGLEVAVADLSYKDLGNLLGELDLKSGEGLWIAPFRGIPETDLRAPLDLIYLDGTCRALEVVESFPTFCATALTSQVASVLALPAHSIYSSQTQPDDQLVLCVAEEMQRRLERLSSSASGASAVRGAAGYEEAPARNNGTRGQSEKQAAQRIQNLPRPDETGLIDPETKQEKPPKSWLERWLSPDPRKAARAQMSGLAAYYWTGAAATPHPVRDVSSTGLYVITEERWYPGTLIQLTLRESGEDAETPVHSITVLSRAVRWGDDGVGLQFIPQDTPGARNQLDPHSVSADRRTLDQFLQRLMKGRV